MSDTIRIFWPGDYRSAPNALALPLLEKATRELESALDLLGKRHKRVEGFLTKPNESISKLGPIDDPIIGLYTHWVYGPHTVDGVIGKNNPLLLLSNFSGTWPGLVGLLNTGACLQAEGRAHSRIWCDQDIRTDAEAMHRLELWCKDGVVRHPDACVQSPHTSSGEADRIASSVVGEIRRKRPLILMLGDTSMGMTNGYFGCRTLHKLGFAEHKVDQAWITDYGRNVPDRRIQDALTFVKSRGVTFHYGGDFDETSTFEQLRDYLAVLDMVEEFEADCIGWQYQLGLIRQRPPSDFAEGLFNSTCRPEGNGDTIVDATEADQGNVLPMELMKRVLKAKGLHQSVAFHDVRWGLEVGGRFAWVLLNSGSSGAFAFNHNPDSLLGVHSYRQPAQYFPTPGGTFAGISRPGKITWARAWLDDGNPVMDLGQGEVLEVSPDLSTDILRSTTPEWPLMVADLGISKNSLMAHFMSNHIAVAYGDILEEMIALCRMLGYKVRLLSDQDLRK
jgi:L-fucose isomerase-like protein